MTDDVTLRLDPHVHSEGSYDGHEPVDLILEHAADIGLDGVVVTDHDEIAESLYAAEISADYGLVGVPGVEVSTAQGHLLALGVEECPEPNRPFAETVETVRELGGAAAVPHPFQRSRHGVRKRNIHDPDAIEVYNSMLFTGFRNRRAKVFAQRRDIPQLGASDAHYLPNVGRAYTEITVPDVGSVTDVDAADLIAALRAGHTQIRGRRTPINKSARQYAKGAVRKSAYLTTSHLPLVPTVPASMRRS